MTLDELKATVALIQYKDCTFNVLEEGSKIFLQITYPALDESGPRTAFARKWLISLDSTRGQIVNTAFKAVLTVEEHEARERFTYRGEAVLHPHTDIEAMVALRKITRANVRFGGHVDNTTPADERPLGTIMQPTMTSRPS